MVCGAPKAEVCLESNKWNWKSYIDTAIPIPITMSARIQQMELKEGFNQSCFSGSRLSYESNKWNWKHTPLSPAHILL